MKTKAKQTLSVLLALTLVLSMFAGCGLSSDLTVNDRWVLTREVTSEGDSTLWEKTYAYDTSGRIIEFGLKSQGLTSTSEDIQYDNHGNVLSYTAVFCFYDEKEPEGKAYYTFLYDENNNCIERTEENEINYTSIREEISYDSYNNAIEEKRIESYGILTYTHNLTYENDKCVMRETIIKNDDSYTIETSYSLTEYTYDKNDNLSSMKYYVSESENATEDEIRQVNGKTYFYSNTTKYVWERLSNVAQKDTEQNKQQIKNDLSSVKIGFDTIDEWGGKLKTIETDDSGNCVFEDSNGIYVIIREGTGIWEFYPQENYAVMSSFYINGAYSTENSGACTILDNDTFVCDGYTMRIINKFVTNGVNVIEMTNGGSRSHLYVPYAFLDVESFELYKEDTEHDFDYYKCYIK